MESELPIIEARNKLTTLPEELEKNPELGAIAVTRRGKPVLAVMSWELYETIMESLEVMADADLMKILRQSLKEAAQGKVHSWESVKRELER